jgi:hypothetical protein
VQSPIALHLNISTLPLVHANVLKNVQAIKSNQFHRAIAIAQMLTKISQLTKSGTNFCAKVFA